MASFYELIKVLSDWLVKKNLNREKSQIYITSLYSALAELVSVNSKQNLKILLLSLKHLVDLIGKV